MIVELREREETRGKTPQTTSETMHVKILVIGGENQTDADEIKFEITNQNDIFFYYVAK